MERRREGRRSVPGRDDGEGGGRREEEEKAQRPKPRAGLGGGRGGGGRRLGGKGAMYRFRRARMLSILGAAAGILELVWGVFWTLISSCLVFFPFQLGLSVFASTSNLPLGDVWQTAMPRS